MGAFLALFLAAGPLFADTRPLPLIPVQLRLPAAEEETTIIGGEEELGADVPGFSKDQLEALDFIVRQLKKRHLNEVDSQDAFYNAIKGMVAALDPNSRFLTPEEYRRSQERSGNGFTGLGVSLKRKVVGEFQGVVRSLPDTPAQKAGVEADDEILAINGEDTRPMDLETLRRKLRVPLVRLRLRRPGREFDVDLVPAGIATPNAGAWMLEGGVGYLALTSFKHESYGLVLNALRELKAQGMRALIFDLRDNPGGELTSVGAITSLFLEPGKRIVSAAGKDGKHRVEYPARLEDLPAEAGEFRGLPLALLVNGRSASASELMAGAVIDYGRGEVVGSRTYGKTTVQMVIPFSRTPNGLNTLGLLFAQNFPALRGGALQITIQRFFTPSGRPIPQTGIEPTIPVEVEPAVERAALDAIGARLRSASAAPGAPDPALERAQRLFHVP